MSIDDGMPSPGVRAPRRRATWRRIALFATVAAVALVAVVIGIADLAFYSVGPADLPCRGCEGDARAVTVDGFDLYYRELGDDGALPPVVVVHGGPGHSSQSFKGALDFLAGDRRVIYYDQRGSGNSEIKPDTAFYTIDRLVDELEALRRTVIGADRIVILAHSAGGALGQRYAIAYPQHVDRLILVSSIPVNNGIGQPLPTDVLLPVLFALGAGLPPADPVEADAWFARQLVATSASRLYDQGKTALVEDSATSRSPPGARCPGRSRDPTSAPRSHESPSRRWSPMVRPTTPRRGRTRRMRSAHRCPTARQSASSRAATGRSSKSRSVSKQR
jgi:pimeloyl-ACP methyl ester carboxylesterase